LQLFHLLAELAHTSDSGEGEEGGEDRDNERCDSHWTLLGLSGPLQGAVLTTLAGRRAAAGGARAARTAVAARAGGRPAPRVLASGLCQRQLVWMRPISAGFRHWNRRRWASNQLMALNVWWQPEQWAREEPVQVSWQPPQPNTSRTPLGTTTLGRRENGSERPC